MPFLKKLAEYLTNSYGEELSSSCIVFPSRRAGIYFRKFLSGYIDKPIWSPAVFSIEDFVWEHSDYINADELVLIFELYDVFRSYGEKESFDEFYPWGEVLLRDFDEIDKNLVSHESLFRVLKETRDVESAFFLGLEELEHFKAFWDTFSNRELNKVQTEFIRIWNMLQNVYSDFKSRLEKKNIAYEGMALRKLCDEIKSGAKSFEIYSNIFFAGFNSLSRGEDFIFRNLSKKVKTEIFWDADNYYIGDDYQEAGKFIRTNLKSFKDNSPRWIGDYLLNNGKKRINIIGAPLNIGQVKSLGDTLKKEISRNFISNDDKTAVILPDENLLIPAIYSIPDEIKKMNVTMGFPFKSTPLYNLINLLKNLQSNKKTSGKDFVFYHQDVIEILMHPYIKFYDPAFSYELVNYIKRYSIIYISGKKIKEHDEDVHELFKLIFSSASTRDEIISYLYDILNVISSKPGNSKESIAKFELEYFYSLYEQLNRIRDIISGFDESVGEKTFWNILLESLKTMKIPFTGEPLEGLQVMGLLESRALDFENVFILSMNEGTLPKGNTHSSFIPYNLRKAFNLPTYEETDSVSAYYFYRLIQKAKNVYLFYNTESNDVYSGEKSRFLLQLESELDGRDNIELNSIVIQTNIDNPSEAEIQIVKTTPLINRLKNEKHFSATDINNYVNCSLKFYFRKAAKLYEEEEIEEFFSPMTFGKIFHKVMENIYSPFKEKLIEDADVDKLIANVKSGYDEIYNETITKIAELKETSKEPLGQNLLFKNIIKKLVIKLLENDKKETPFVLKNTELTIEKDISISANDEEYNVKLYGIIDRVDEKDGTIRIFDYKTGVVSKKDKGTMEEYFSKPEYKATLQTAVYGYLYLSQYSSPKIQLGIYPVKKLDDGITFIDNIDLTGTDFVLFEENLKKLFAEIFDKNIPFTKTKDKKRCRYCPYIGICYRE
ncbi:MAG: PD-(D/E)XK nuclease family protein [Ignavibacteria bacterium]